MADKQSSTIPLGDINLGGMANSKWSGPKNSWYKLVGQDLHSTPGVIGIRQKMARIGSALVDSFAKEKVDCSDGNRYWFSSTTGKVWKEASDTITLVLTAVPTNGGAGCLGAYEYDGYIYWATEKWLHRIRVDKTSDWATNAEQNWSSLNLDQPELGSAASTYSLTNAVNEGATHKRSFTPLNSPIEAFAINVHGIGTSVDWTLKLHDSSNNELASVTITAANMATGWKFFTLSSVFYPVLGQTYHIHIYASATTGTPAVKATTSTDFTTGNVRIYTTSDSEFHPMIDQNLVLYIGDREFVHQVEPAADGSHVFTREALDIPKPNRVKCLGKELTDLLIGTIINSKVTKAYLYRWNTWSESFMNPDDVDEVGINAFIYGDNVTFVSAGIQGNLYYVNGSKLEIWKRIPGTYSPTSYGVIHPNAVGNLGGLMLAGFSNGLGNPTEQGIYVVGRNSRDYPIVLDLSFPMSPRISSDLVLTDMEVGAIIVSGLNLYASWKRAKTITVTIADPAVITYTGHNFSDGDPIVFTTTGTLPTGITAGTTYFVKSVSANTLHLYDTSAHAISGGSTGRVITSVSQSGVHTATDYGIDKLNYSAKLEKAYAESRVLIPDRRRISTFSEFFVGYESLPASTAILLGWRKNHTSDAYNDIGLVKDAKRIGMMSDKTVEASVLQIKLTFTVNNNDAPNWEGVSIGVI